MTNGNDTYQSAVASGVDEDLIALYRRAHAESSCEAQLDRDVMLWQDSLHLEQLGDTDRCRRLREFAPVHAVSTMSREPRSKHDVTLKMGLLRQVEPAPGSIVAEMFDTIITVHGYELGVAHKDVTICHPAFDPRRTGVNERFRFYADERLLASPTHFIAEARRHVANSEKLGSINPAAEMGGIDMAITCALMACAVPSRVMSELQAKSVLVTDILPMVRRRRILAMPMMIAAMRVEGATWGLTANYLMGWA